MLARSSLHYASVGDGMAIFGLGYFAFIWLSMASLLAMSLIPFDSSALDPRLLWPSLISSIPRLTLNACSAWVSFELGGVESAVRPCTRTISASRSSSSFVLNEFPKSKSRSQATQQLAVTFNFSLEKCSRVKNIFMRRSGLRLKSASLSRWLSISFTTSDNSRKTIAHTLAHSIWKQLGTFFVIKGSSVVGPVVDGVRYYN